MLNAVVKLTGVLSLKVLCLLLVSCSVTKQTARSLCTDYIGVKNLRVSDTLDLYYFPPLRPDEIYCSKIRPCSSNNGRGDLITSDTSQQRPFHARLIRHTTANVADTDHYQVNEQEQVTKVKQPPAPILDTGSKIVLSLIIFFGFVFIASLILVIWKLLRLTGSQ